MKLLRVLLPDRAVLRLAGDDARLFLQGLVSNDVRRVDPEHAIWAAFLTPQGKYLHDFFICEQGGNLLLDAEAGRLQDLKRRLSMYRLRSKASIEEAGDWHVWALLGSGADRAVGVMGTEPGAAASLDSGIVFADPRRDDIGLRAILPLGGEEALASRGFAAGDRADYERLRISLGLPDGSRDMLVDRSLLLEGGFDELNGIDWHKGCYLGQELTARTRYRGLVKKRLLAVRLEGPPPPSGTPILFGDREVGEIRSSADDIGLAILRLDALDAITGAGGVMVGETRLIPLGSAAAPGVVS